MKRNIFNFILIYFVTILLVTLFSAFNPTIEANAESKINQSKSEQEVTHSIFIQSPTYSFLFSEKIYFFDEFDNLLKIYNLETEKFEQNYISLNSLGNIIDVASSNEFVFVLSKQQSENSEDKLQLNIINLNNFEIIKSIELENISINYSKISICSLDTEWYVSFTPTLLNDETTDEALPIIAIINKETLDISNVCTIEINSDINSKLFKFLIIESNDANNDIHLIFTYNENITFFSCEINQLKIDTNIAINLNIGTNFQNLDTTNSNIEFLNINTMIVNNELHFLISYQTNEDSAYSKLYKCVIDNVNDQNKLFTSKLTVQTERNKYITTTGEYVLYPVDKQQILYNNISYDTELEEYSDNGRKLSNPNVTVEYKSENEFEYATINKSTNILSSPWDSSSIYQITFTETQNDVIIIGHGKIDGESTHITDYIYCLYTTNDSNIKGFIKVEDLTLKQKIDKNDFKYKIFKVQPNTKLYSLPTTIVDDYITPTLKSDIIIEIKENSKIEVVDVICNYKSYDDIMIKVKVNNSEIGYIELNKIIKPSESVNFIITNATIKEDNTEIYLESNDSSPVIYKLSKGYRIKINNIRDTKSGYTSITFNDEYGNEFTGYILTDSLSSDSWSTLQIIGCVLIAVNIGLLILILRFKKNHIGYNGSKFISYKK